MEVEQKISNFLKKRLEKFASCQDEERQINPRKESFSTSQGSSPKAFHNQHPPHRTSSTYQSTRQVPESHEAELVGYFAQDNSASLDNQFHGNQERFSKKVYGRSSSSVDDYYGKTQWRADMMNNLERNNKAADTLKKEYRRSISGPAGLNDGQKEWIGSPQRKEEMGFLHSASGVHTSGQKKMINSPKRPETMEFQRPASGVYNYGQNQWIDSPKRREPIEKMKILETDQAVELTIALHNYDQRGWSGSPQKRDVMEIRRFSPGVQNYAQKEYIGSPRMQDQRKMMQNLEANKVGGFSRTHEYHQGQGSYEEQSYYHQSQPNRADYGHQMKGPFMDSIEAAKLHGGVVIFDYSKY